MKREDDHRGIPDYSAEDLEAVKGPGLVQSMLDIQEESEDSDNEGDQVTKLQERLKKAGMGEATEKRNDGSTGSQLLEMKEFDNKRKTQ